MTKNTDVRTLESLSAAQKFVQSMRRDATAEFMRGDGPMIDAFQHGAAWQKERDNLMPEAPEFDHVKAWNKMREFRNETRDALGTLGEGIAEMLKRQGDLNAMGLRGSDRGVAILKHLQEIGDAARRIEHDTATLRADVSMTDDMIRDVGEKVEAVLDQVMPQEVDAMAEVKAEPAGKTSAVSIKDVSDEMLDDLHRSGQITTARYIEERGDRQARAILGPRVDADKIGVDPAHGADAMAYTFMRDGKTLGVVKDMGATSEGFAVATIDGGRVIVLHRGRLYDLRGMDLIPLRFGA